MSLRIKSKTLVTFRLWQETAGQMTEKTAEKTPASNP